jgi:hypothetical protein
LRILLLFLASAGAANHSAPGQVFGPKGRAMPRILAIESDSRRRALLGALVREHVQADLTIADSVKAAIRELSARIPDAILVPPLLSPREVSELMDFVKQLDAPYVELLTMSAFDMLSDCTIEEKRTFGVLWRRQTPEAPQYDRDLVGRQIAEGVARAREARVEYARMLAYRAEREELEKRRLAGAMADAAGLVLATRRQQESIRDERRIATRVAHEKLSWLSDARLAWDTEIALVNISNSGVLLESGSKLAPGSTTELRLIGPAADVVVPVRFIRSEIAKVDPVGVRYRAAAEFDREIDLARLARASGKTSSASHALAELLAGCLDDSGLLQDPAHVRFVRGVRELVGARDVQVRTASAPSDAGCETLYFDVPGDGRARKTMQVVFDRGHDVTASEFTLLKAAAWLAAAALELEKPEVRVADPARPVALLTERVA